MSLRKLNAFRCRCSFKSFMCRFLCRVVLSLYFLPSTFYDTHVTALAAAAAGPSSASVSCPTACFCNAPSRIVYCSRRGLTVVPDGVAADSLQLNLNGNVFQSTTLRRGNFSGMTALEHLYLSECGIERLEVKIDESLIFSAYLLACFENWIVFCSLYGREFVSVCRIKDIQRQTPIKGVCKYCSGRRSIYCVWLM